VQVLRKASTGTVTPEKPLCEGLGLPTGHCEAKCVDKIAALLCRTAGAPDK
jgi:hypothetical protein